MPDRRRRAGGRPPAGQAGVRPGLHVAAGDRRAPLRDRAQVPERAQGDLSRRGCSSVRRCQPLRACPSSGGPSALAKKVAAGAQFVQTQYCYDVPRLRAFMARGGRPGPARTKYSSWSASVRCARPRPAEWMRTPRRRASTYPDERHQAAWRRAEKQALEGRQVCIDIIQESPGHQGGLAGCT